MKHFIYTYHEKCRQSATVKSVRIYRVKRGIPELVATGEDTYVSEFQLVMMLMQAKQLLPRKCFEPNNFGGFKYWYSSGLEAAGIASVRRVS